MRLAALALMVAVASAGCFGLGVPSLRVTNTTDAPIEGALELYRDRAAAEAEDAPLDTWSFRVAPGESSEVARLPREPRDYHWLVVQLTDGRRHEGAVHNGDHFFDADVRILADRIEIAQAVG